MGAVAHFLGEDVAWVNCTRNVVQIYFLSLDAVTDGEVFEVDVTHPLGGGTLRPVDGTLVVIVEAGVSIGIGEVRIVAPVAKREDFFDGFIRSRDFGFAGGAACSRLVDGLPGDGASTAHNEESAHGEVFEHLHLRAVLEGQTNLTAPVCVAETLERLAVRGGVALV